MRAFQKAYIGLGANLGNPKETFYAALEQLKQLPEVMGLRCSHFYLTTPVSPIPQPDFLNAVCEVETSYAPQLLFREMERIERKLGKVDKPKTDPRRIDLDLLFMSQIRINTANLQLPHPGLRSRLFVLVPLSELTLSIPKEDGTTLSIKETIAQLKKGSSEQITLYNQDYQL